MKEIMLIYCLGICLTMSGQASLDANKISSIIASEAKAGHFSGNILIASKDSIVLLQSEGYADREHDQLNKPGTKFNIASTGKLLTRIAILQLIQEAKLSFDDTFAKFFPDHAQKPIGKVTIRQLLNHQAGLGDIYVDKQYLKPENYTSQDNVISLIAQEKLAFEPGSAEAYSNSGYYVLGAIISKVMGKSFAECLQEKIFLPLEMNNSGSANVGDKITDHAVPYKKNSRRSEPATIGEPPSGAGSQYSTVEDLNKLFQSIAGDNQLLTDEYKALLFTKFQPGNWNEIIKSGKITGYLGGDTRGWSAKITFMFSSPAALGVIILTNYDDQAHPLDLKIREILLQK